LVVLLVALQLQMRTTPPAPAPAPGSNRGRPQGKAPSTPAKVPALRVDRLEKPLPPLRAEAKNLFAPLVDPPPPPPPTKAAPPPPPPPDPFLEEAKKLKVVAVMQEGTQRMAFIEDGNEVHNVKQNDVIRSRFLIKELTDDAVVVSTPDGQKEFRLSLAPSGGPARP
jgi:hypothetical protein